ncbi:MAG: TrmH family RNA methyltransferase [Planctomycetota bacterium]|nr:MAG: TrmH family RNA methyltransferase [Planctomycetota bacterium]
MRGSLAPSHSTILPSPIPAHPAEHLLSPQRQQRFRQVLARRTVRLSVVIEECYDPHNATAIVRTCDALGIHRVHVVTGRNAFQVNRRISQGAHHNVDLRIHHTIDAAYDQLRHDDFRIYASNLQNTAQCGPGALAPMLHNQPLALVFGNEGHGLSDAAIDQADDCFLIPMSGFPQSLNLSVSVAICCYALRQPWLEGDLAGDMPAEEQGMWYDQWLRRSASVQRYCEEHGYPPADTRAEESCDRSGNPIERFHAGYTSSQASGNDGQDGP